MTRILLTSATALALSCGGAVAGGLQPPIQVIAPVQVNTASVVNCPAAQPVVAALQAQGYTRVEVEPGIGQARFSAVRDDMRATYVYDCRTGTVLQSSGARVQTGEDLTPGVFTMPSAGADFVTAEAAMAAAADDDGAMVDATAGAGIQLEDSAEEPVAGVGSDADVSGTGNGGGISADDF